MKRLAAIACLALAACVVPSQPPVVTPGVPLWNFSLVVTSETGAPVRQAVARIVEGGQTVTGNDVGFVDFGPMSQRDMNVCVSAQRFEEQCFGVHLFEHVQAKPVTLAAATPAQPELRSVILQRRPTLDDGTPWVWRGITSFRLAHQIANGEAEAASQWMAEASALGFNVVRVLSTAVHLFDLPYAQGAAAVPALLQEAARYGLYVDLVAVADSADRPGWREHARAVAVVCAAHSNCIYEYANEPYHPTQDPALHAPADAEREAADAVRDLPALSRRWLVGPGPVDEAPEPAAGAAVSRHLDRGRDVLNQARHYKDVLELSDRLDQYVIGNEPTGAAERRPGASVTDCESTVTGGQRFWCPQFFAILGFLEAGFGGGGTFHLQAGLRQTAMTADERIAATAYLDAGRLIPDAERGLWTFMNAGHEGSPVTNAGGSAAFEDPLGGPVVRAYSFVRDGRGFVGVIHRPAAFPEGVLSFGNGWRRGAAVVSHPQFTVFQIEQE